jgi:hypothetical protein
MGMSVDAVVIWGFHVTNEDAWELLEQINATNELSIDHPCELFDAYPEYTCGWSGHSDVEPGYYIGIPMSNVTWGAEPLYTREVTQKEIDALNDWWKENVNSTPPQQCFWLIAEFSQ